MKILEDEGIEFKKPMSAPAEYSVSSIETTTVAGYEMTITLKFISPDSVYDRPIEECVLYWAGYYREPENNIVQNDKNYRNWMAYYDEMKIKLKSMCMNQVKSY